MSRQTPPRRASGERLIAPALNPSPEPTAVGTATGTARAESLGLPAAWVKKGQIAHRDRPPVKNPKVFDPAKHCGAPTNAKFNGARPCTLSKGWGTDHKGSGHCRNHFGNAPNGRTHAESEAKAKAAIESFVDLSLANIGNALAREAASRAFGTPETNAEDFARNVVAFDRAADRAEGSKVTIETKLSFLAQLPDAELDAAIAEAQRLVTLVKGAPHDV